MKKINISPYNKVWMNCYINGQLSIALLKHKDYELCILRNNYYYALTEDNKLTYNNDTIFFEDIIKQKDKSISYFHLIDELKSEIDDEKYVFYPVNLKYWIEESINWERYENVHYSLIIGYDDEKEEIIAFDDGYKGYGEWRIPYERFYIAVARSMQKVKYYSIHNECEYIFRYDKKSFLDDVEKILLSINDVIREYDIWNRNLKNQDLYIFPIIAQNRMRGNFMFIQYMCEKKILNFNKENLCIIEDGFSDLMEKWETAKNYCTKKIISNKSIEIDKLNLYSKEAIMLEGKLWTQIKEMC